ncbi:hypothetical protein MMC06_002796 [Schaereria dolodes]|nr:hypothetical protein [Schaereria dolodes]
MCLKKVHRFGPANSYFHTGLVDLNSKVVTDANKGFYYLLYHGLQLLCGKEGMDNGLFKICPSYKKLLGGITHFGFKIGYPAVVQKRAGSQDDRYMPPPPSSDEEEIEEDESEGEGSGE